MSFEQSDDSFREGRVTDSIFLQKGVTTESVIVRILLLSVSQFEEYRNNTPERNFGQDFLDMIDAIEFPATRKNIYVCLLLI